MQKEIDREVSIRQRRQYVLKKARLYNNTAPGQKHSCRIQFTQEKSKSQLKPDDALTQILQGCGNWRKWPAINRNNNETSLSCL